MAEVFAEEGGKVFLVEQSGVKPMLLDTPEKFVAAWEASGADSVEGDFHPDQTRRRPITLDTRRS